MANVNIVSRFCFFAIALSSPSVNAATPTSFISNVSVGVAARQDNIDWSIKGTTVNVLSELKWKKLNTPQIHIATNLNLPKALFLSLQMAGGDISSGSNEDTDYNGNNRTLPFLRSESKGDGRLTDIEVTLGQSLSFLNNTLIIKPKIGFFRYNQNLTMSDGYQVIPNYGSIFGLNNSYDMQWQGVLLGVDVSKKITNNCLISFGFEYGRADYTAQANWNLRKEFMHPLSFRHMANASGISLNVAADYKINNKIKWQFFLKNKKWQTQEGVDETYFTNNTIAAYP